MQVTKTYTLRLFILLQLCISNQVYAQSQDKQNIGDDEIKRLLLLSDDTVKVNRLNETGRSLREKDNRQAMVLAQKALAIADSIHYQKGQAIAYDNIGWIYYRRADFIQAMENITKALQLAEKSNDLVLLSSGQNNLGAIYTEQKDYRKAMAAFAKGHTYALQANYSYGIERSLNNLAYVHFLNNSLDSSKYYVQKVLALPGFTMGGFANRMLGDIYVLENNFEVAENHYRQSKEAATRVKNSALLVSVLHRLGDLYLKQNLVPKSISILKENEGICKQNSFNNELVNTYLKLSKAYKTIGDFKSSTHYLEQYISLNDSLYNNSVYKKLSQQEEKYQDQLTQTKLDLLTKESQLKESEIESANLKLYTTAAALILLTGFGFILFNNNKKLKSANDLLEQQSKEIRKNETELSFLNATKDKILSIIGHDLRSPVNSMKGILTLLNSGNMTQAELKSISLELNKRFDALHDDLGNLLLWSKSQMEGIKANPKEIQLFSASQMIVQTFAVASQEKSIVIENNISNKLTVFADEDQLKVIIKNLLGNAIKFSFSGGKVSMDAFEKENIIELIVKDQGAGMTPEQLSNLFNPLTHFTTAGTKNERGFGLGLMLVKEFVDLNNGQIQVESKINEGTIFTIELPASHSFNG